MPTLAYAPQPEDLKEYFFEPPVLTQPAKAEAVEEPEPGEPQGHHTPRIRPPSTRMV